MLRKTPTCPVYVGPKDLRNNIDGLIIKIKYQFNLNPFSPEMFVFCNNQGISLRFYFGTRMDFGSTIADLIQVLSIGRKKMMARKLLRLQSSNYPGY